MLKKHLLPLGLAFGLVLTGIGGTAVWIDHDPSADRAAQQVLPAQAKPNRAAEPGASTEMQRLREGIDEIRRLATAQARDVGDLRTRMASLEVREQEMRRELNDADVRDADRPADAPRTRAAAAPPAPPSAGDLARAEEKTEAWLKALDQKAQTERLDRPWATAAERKIKEQVAKQAIPGLNLVEAKCRSSLCRVEMARDPSMPAGDSIRHLSALSPWPAATTTYAADTGEVVVYVAREGHAMP